MDLEPLLNSTMAFNITNDTSVKVCDYFEIGVGYQFSQCDQDIGLVVIQDRVGAEMDLYYQNLTMEGDVLYWDWTELETLVNAYTNKVCPMPEPGSPNPVEYYGPQVWFNLTLPWSDWNLTAQEDNNVSMWNKTVWKYWINNYVTYYDVLQQYIFDMNIAVNATSGAPQVGDSGSGSQNVTNATSSIIFTDIWNSTFDNSATTLDFILTTLNETSTIVGQCKTWFTEFFGANGIVTLNITQESVIPIANSTVPTTTGGASNKTIDGIPADLIDIVEWIRIQVEMEIRLRWESHMPNSTNSTDNSTGTPPGSGSGSNGTDNSTGSGNGTDNSTGSGNGTGNGTGSGNGSGSGNGTDNSTAGPYYTF